jgi:hypothetical protein
LLLILWLRISPKGTPARDKFETGFEEFKVGAMIHEADWLKE